MGGGGGGGSLGSYLSSRELRSGANARSPELPAGPATARETAEQGLVGQCGQLARNTYKFK